MYIEERKVIEMSELLFFVLGFIIGGLAMTTLMCCLQVNRISELERQIVLRDNEKML